MIRKMLEHRDWVENVKYRINSYVVFITIQALTCYCCQCLFNFYSNGVIIVELLSKDLLVKK